MGFGSKDNLFKIGFGEGKSNPWLKGARKNLCVDCDHPLSLHSFMVVDGEDVGSKCRVKSCPCA